MSTKLVVLLLVIFCIGIFATFYSQSKNDKDNTNICNVCLSPGDQIVLYRLVGDTTSIRLKINDVCSSNNYVELGLVGDTTSGAALIGDTTSIMIPQAFTIQEVKVGVSNK